MNDITHPPLFKQEREQTDDSLDNERVKTDNSLAGIQKKAELKTDEKVKSNRQESDEARALGRLESDNKIISQESADHLQEERSQEDDAVVKERKQMDAVIRDERKQNAILLNTSLTKEREDTDQNLLNERMRVDMEVVKSDNKFDLEQNSHSETKVALTTRDEILAIVSHDLRNPIGAVQSASEYLLGIPADKRTVEDVNICLLMIKRNAQKSLRLIGDILDMERFAEGKFQLDKRLCNIEELVAELIQSHTYEANEKKIQLEILPNTKGMHINCDQDRIGQVIANLLSNAIKFTPPGGKISVEIKQVGTEIQISIIDTGPGIADIEQQRIFDRFTQINNSDRRGLGLGLYISKMLVEAHKGKLWLTSIVGKGTTFHISIPDQN